MERRTENESSLTAFSYKRTCIQNICSVFFFLLQDVKLDHVLHATQ